MESVSLLPARKAATLLDSTRTTRARCCIASTWGEPLWAQIVAAAARLCGAALWTISSFTTAQAAPGSLHCGRTPANVSGHLLRPRPQLEDAGLRLARHQP